MWLTIAIIVSAVVAVTSFLYLWNEKMVRDTERKINAYARA